MRAFDTSGTVIELSGTQRRYIGNGQLDISGTFLRHIGNEHAVKMPRSQWLVEHFGHPNYLTLRMNPLTGFEIFFSFLRRKELRFHGPARLHVDLRPKASARIE